MRQRSSDLETSAANPRILGRDAVARRNLRPEAVGPDELAPGSVRRRHLAAGLLDDIGGRPGSLLHLGAQDVPVPSGGVYIPWSGRIASGVGFEEVAGGSDAIVLPGPGTYQVSLALRWATSESGGEVRLDVGPAAGGPSEGRWPISGLGRWSSDVGRQFEDWCPGIVVGAAQRLQVALWHGASGTQTLEAAQITVIKVGG